jgi:hypothetical protein
MLEDLITLAAHGNTASRAGSLLLRAYGVRALSAVDAALATRGVDREGRARLERLRAFLSTSAVP